MNAGREDVAATDGVESHRLMVSRCHPKETGFLVEYPDALILEVYELEDRAYYPSRPNYRG